MVVPVKKDNNDTTWIILVSLIKDDVKYHWTQTRTQTGPSLVPVETRFFPTVSVVKFIKNAAKC